MDEIRDFDLGYAVGLYEGEGTINLARDKRRNGRNYARFKIRMIDREPLERMKAAMGGFVRDAYRSPKEAAAGYQYKFRWEVATIDGVQRVARLMLPHLSPRRQAQITAVLEAIDRNPTNFPVAKRFGQLVCPPQVIASARGYNRHRLLGIPPCQICLDSAALWAKENRGKHPERKERKASYMREWNLRHKGTREQRRAAKVEARRLLIETERERLRQLTDTSSENQPALSPDAAS